MSTSYQGPGFRINTAVRERLRAKKIVHIFVNISMLIALRVSRGANYFVLIFNNLIFP